MSDSPAPAPANTISLDQAARLLMCTPQWVMKLKRDGYIPTPYTIVGCVHGYIKWSKDDARRTSKTAGDSRVREARADEIEVRIIEKKKLLIEEARQEGLALIDAYGGGLKSDLLSIPARVTKDLALRRRIESEINGAFSGAAKRIADELAGASETSATVDTGKTANAGSVGRGKSRVSGKRGRTGKA